jgi:bleomycin hydrolase
MTTISTAPGRTAPAARFAQDQAASITPAFLDEARADFAAAPVHRVAQNAVTRTCVADVALNRAAVTSLDHTFSHVLDDWEVTNQKQSGRCWMFAALNLLRVPAMKAMNLKAFEFSQNYTLFWDKLERANYFLEAIIETAHLDVDDRTVAFLLARPLDDGGQWNMFTAIVKKHGLVPKALMPETESSSNTRFMNRVLIAKLREGAKTLRALRAGGAPMEAARAAKRKILNVIYRILAIHLGDPPARFTWQWNDKDRGFRREEETTPREFAAKHVTVPLDEYVCLVHDPRATSPFGRTFTVRYLGNVAGGEPVKYLNVEIDVMKEIAVRTITGGEPVWFGCDVDKMMHRQLGLWDAKLYDFESLYGTTFGLDKEDRLLHHETLMTHAMLFTGVDVVDGRPRRWRVENSWGDENGLKGFFAMNDSWFDEHMFEIAAHRKHLSRELRAAFDQEPIVLPPWDPMGALAR